MKGRKGFVIFAIIANIFRVLGLKGMKKVVLLHSRSEK